MGEKEIVLRACMYVGTPAAEEYCNVVCAGDECTSDNSAPSLDLPISFP